MSRAEKIAGFDPNSPGDPTGNIYGLPFDTDEAQVVIVPVPWDVTVSYQDGASRGPDAVLAASVQVDLFDPSVKDAWKIGLAMDDISVEVTDRSKHFRELALKHAVEAVNEGSRWLNSWVEARCGQWLDAGKAVALLGGDHSTPHGFLRALAARHASLGILQIDAHADLRDAYEGFSGSHASIMRNALGIPQVAKLVQAGIRDYCDEEAQVIAREPRVTTFFDRDLKRGRFNGETWAAQTKTIVDALPEKVYVSFDIDGLDPKLCPNTGTPVAGGFEYEEAIYLVESVARSGRTIIGLDLNEVAPGDSGNEWDANVGARLLYRMCNLMALSQGKASRG
ncbi:MAG: agmatinase family protein [Acidobacteria bacterium]|nr:MAG: agmatinase family protein [Acidobacteriota bacterium]